MWAILILPLATTFKAPACLEIVARHVVTGLAAMVVDRWVLLGSIPGMLIRFDYSHSTRKVLAFILGGDQRVAARSLCRPVQTGSQIYLAALSCRFRGLATA
jgi:hypothetical protein